MSSSPDLLSRVLAICSKLSGMEVEELDARATFVAQGFDSLFLTQLASAFHGELGVKVTFRQLYSDYPSIERLVEYVGSVIPTQMSPPGSQATARANTQPATVAREAAEISRVAYEEPSAAGPGLVIGDSDLTAVLSKQLEVISRQLEFIGRIGGKPVLATNQRIVVAPSDAAPALDSPSAPGPGSHGTEGARPALPKGFGPSAPSVTSALTARQQDHLDRLIGRYTRRTAGSKARTQNYRALHADPRTAAGFNRLWKEMVYPIVVSRSSGSRLWDVDGNEYIDILNGFGPNFLGHSPPFVTAALRAQLDRGFEVGPQTPLVGETSELFCEMTGMDRVSWVNTGSEAVQAAIRLSRTVTGRTKIVVFAGDYHGNFDEVLVRMTKTKAGRKTLPLAPGIPQRAVDDVLVLDYGTDESLAIIQKEAASIAAVLVEPIQSRRPDFQPREFLHALRSLTEKEGIVLVFDEVITGFRVSPGGAQEYYGVRADLATYGKIIGGGMPIGVIAGSRQFMDTFDGGMWQYGDDSFPSAGVTFFAGTFVRHPLAIAAAHSVLTYLKAAGPALQEGVNRRTSYFANTLNQHFEKSGLKIRIPHFSSQMFIRVGEDSELATLLFYHLRDRGVHVLEGFPSYMTAAHTDQDVETLIDAFRDSVGEMLHDGVLTPEAGDRSALQWRRRFPLSNGQAEIWLACHDDPEASCAFNESDSISLNGKIDLPKLVEATEVVLARHEALHLRFSADGDSQFVDESLCIIPSVHDMSGLDAQSAQAAYEELITSESGTPFDLAEGPLARVHIVHLSDDRHRLLIYAHHLIFDGWSSEVLLKEIGRTYSCLRSGKPFESADPPTFSTYAAGGYEPRAGAVQSGAEQYWRGVFAGGLPAPLELPLDRSRPNQLRFAGGTAHLDLGRALSMEVRAAARELSAPLYSFLLAGFAALLARITGQEDFVVGIPAAGQARVNKDVVGYCVSMLPMRVSPKLASPFSEHVVGVHRSILDGFENQNVTVSELLAATSASRDSSRLPLVEVVFNYSSYFSGIAFDGCTVEASENPRRSVFHDLFFNVVERDGDLVIDCDYRTSILDGETVMSWCQLYAQLLRSAAMRPHGSIGDLELAAADDGRSILRS